MKKYILILLPILILASCTAPPPRFSRMNDAEIFAYNDSVGFQDQVYCTTDVRTGSHIRERICMTIADLEKHNARQINFLSTAGAGAGVFK